MSKTAITHFLGDRERVFDLLPRLAELEKIVGTPAGMIVKRVIAADFAATDCPTIVRLALIGGGENPKDAAQLAADYVLNRPLSEGHKLATAIVLAAWIGTPPKPAPAATPQDDQAPGEITFVKFDALGTESVVGTIGR